MGTWSTKRRIAFLGGGIATHPATAVANGARPTKTPLKERIMNRLNPCHQCHRRDKDKNNSQCRVCNKRIAYLRRLACDLEFSASVAVDHGYPLHLPARRS